MVYPFNFTGRGFYVSVELICILHIAYFMLLFLYFQLSKDLTCLVQWEFVDLYIGLSWKKKYHSPTDFCFALKVRHFHLSFLCCCFFNEENKSLVVSQ